MIPIVPGRPFPHNGANGEPASFTRFVLPFAYDVASTRDRVGTSEGGVSPAVYRATEPDVSRLDYFTSETAKALFERAAWFHLCHPDSGGRPWSARARFPLGSSSWFLEISVPALVLFEFAAVVGPRRTRSRGALGALDLLATAFLVVELSFSDGQQPGLDELLELNELFRYCQRPFAGHADDRTPKGSTYRSAVAAFREALEGLGIELSAGVGIRDEEAELYAGRWWHLLRFPLIDAPGGPWHLVPSRHTYADARTFVWSCAILPDGFSGVRREFPDSLCGSMPGSGVERTRTESQGLDAHLYGHWVKLLNVDRPSPTSLATNATTAFEREWTRDHTYHRWEEQGIVYGFSYHSGTLIAPPMRNPDVWRHFGDMYFDQALLLLYLRVSLFRFSVKLADISALARDEGESTRARRRWEEDFETLRWHFALLANLYQFPLISNQQQGIELYGLMRRSMDVEELFREIKEEITSSHDYLQIKKSLAHADTATRLTRIATYGLPVALAVGALGMSLWIPSVHDTWKAWDQIKLAGGVLVTCVTLVWLALTVPPGLSRLRNRFTRWRSRA